ncbi:hypothetical protein [Spiroplasma cantharicola]|uniref:Uncharacterized protein n=1 Tax=Spiroplasma cantharicola TaxID=362837 RepID=A0A0M3SJ40_9MOLU|nr:hypothetical protein [Spiroplasma cantharicola]ALD66078.1 hypothetical protein SCANT_v1c01680 [Spiroplasma cantharicola]
MEQNQIIGLLLIVIGLLIIIGFGYWAYYAKNKAKNNSNFKTGNQESQTIWEFTKKNFPIFVAIFGFIMAFTGLMMMF